MCKWEEKETWMLSCGPVELDSCLVPLVRALDNAGIKTVASCCGHGNRPGNIALADGRELIIAQDFATGRKIDQAFPDIHGKVIHNTKCGGDPSDPITQVLAEYHL